MPCGVFVDRNRVVKLHVRKMMSGVLDFGKVTLLRVVGQFELLFTEARRAVRKHRYEITLETIIAVVV